eukprot:gnl/MRDRNA2_/MRDRNA2_37731_c0_seq1.p1 gnl/MRDRNA2_/MRDRNA2_37731_c0~~gnl/MRDRNA2_/MRDRNA2_37731_c0_seq1.p1  ORF type:complete len:324 (+),score=62.63 gnl/MRDRNA2_/MRDRNA2_37731_c0_seq1:115-1086(+)
MDSVVNSVALTKSLAVSFKRDQAVRQAAADARLAQSTSALGVSRTPGDRSSQSLGGKHMGQSKSCPSLPLVAEHENKAKANKQMRRPSLLPMSALAALPPITGNATSKSSSKTPKFLYQTAGYIHNNEEPRSSTLKPKTTLITRMMDIERSMHKLQEEIEDRREVLDFFNLKKRQAKDAAKRKKLESMAVEEVLESALQSPRSPTSTVQARSSASNMQARSLYQARGRTGQKSGFGSFSGFRSFMKHNPAIDAPDTPSNETMSRLPPVFPPEAYKSMNEKLRAYEQMAMYNAKTLSSQRRFIDELNVIVESGKAAAISLADED